MELHGWLLGSMGMDWVFVGQPRRPRNILFPLRGDGLSNIPDDGWPSDRALVSARVTELPATGFAFLRFIRSCKIPKKAPGAARQKPPPLRKNSDPSPQVTDSSRIMAEKNVVVVADLTGPGALVLRRIDAWMRNQGRGCMCNPFKGASHERRPPLLRPFRA